MTFFWGIELDGQWFCMKYNCWRSNLEQDCIYSKENASFFLQRWFTDEQKVKARLVPFELKRLPEG